MPETLETIAERVSAVSAAVDKEFGSVSAAIAEQREYTEEAFATLKAEMNAGFGGLDRKFDQIDRKFEQVDRKIEQVDRKIEQVDRKIDRVVTLLAARPRRRRRS